MKRSDNIYLTAPVRTPIGKFGGALRSLTAVELGTCSAVETIRRSSIETGCVDEVIIGTARQAGMGPNPARQISCRSGIPVSAPAFTVNKACASGLKAIICAFQSIALGDAEVVLAGGIESMSNIPYLLTGARWGYRLGHHQIVDGNYKDGYLCPLCDELMGATAENLAEKYKIPRQLSDEYALMSQHRCAVAQKNGRFQEEIVSVQVTDKQGSGHSVAVDEHPRPETSLQQLAKLKPVFRENGTVHAGNSSGITDGAATVLLFSEKARSEYGLKPVARIRDYTIAGVDPAFMGIGPVPAVQRLLQRNNLQLADIDLVELNEAFAVQVLSCERELALDMSKVNVNGGAIALGHPTGCTGTRITVTLLHEMRRVGAELGIATLCVSGGMGVALLVELV